MPDDLRARLASALTAYRGQPADSDLDAKVAAERRFADALEEWIASLLPGDESRAGRFAGRWYDGLLLEDQRYDEQGALHICGWIFHVGTHEQHPFQVRLSKDLLGYTLLFADASGPDRRPRHRHLQLDADRAWLFHLSNE